MNEVVTEIVRVPLVETETIEDLFTKHDEIVRILEEIRSEKNMDALYAAERDNMVGAEENEDVF